MYDWLIPSHSSLSLCTVPLQPLKYQCGPNVYCDTCQQFTLFLVWIRVSGLQLSDAEKHNHPVLHIVLHGTTVHFYSGQLLLSHVHLRDFNFQMLPILYKDVCTWNVCALLHSHLILTFISMCHMLSNIHIHAAWPHFCRKGILVMT
jgi:hypothetical protein